VGVVLLYDLKDSKGAIRAWKELIEMNPFASKAKKIKVK
jgi:hypothetical protein